jgi:monoamine oxidase
MTDALDRRTFLRRAVAGAAALSTGVIPRGLTSFAARSGRTGAPQKIIVVGAGMAGLSAALQLVEAGHDVTVLEARTRPGGRVFTIREPFADGLYAEGGAMQVFDSHPRVQRYIQQFGLETDAIHPAPGTSLIHVKGNRIAMKPGERVAWPFELKDDEQSLDARGLWDKYVLPAVIEAAEAEAADPMLRALAKYDRITFSEFLRGRGASPNAIAVIAVGLVSGLGDGADRVSALNLLREAAHRRARKDSFTIRGGTDRLPRALAARLADRIRYGSPVVRLEQSSAGVRVVALEGGMPRTFEGDRIVCAIPFSVLRRLDVARAFPGDKQTAITQLKYTSVTRVFVQTRTRFWLTAGLSANASTDLPVMGIYERAINQPATRGLLESYMAGAAARRAMAMAPGERLTSALTGMAKVYPQIRAEHEGGTSKSWDDDEWSRGAYAWFEPGEMMSLMPVIVRPEGRIHFAGDHASTQPGWMEGAVESADRVVREIDRMT